MIIRWTNKYSGEQGFVKKLNHKEGYFENTFDPSEALSVSAKKGVAARTITLLDKYCSDNTYEAIER